MTTTSFEPASAERHTVGRLGKLGTARPTGQSGSLPGQFAALMLLQANEDASPNATGNGMTPPEDESKNPFEVDAKTDLPTGTDAAQLALQALMDWRGHTAVPSTVADAAKTVGTAVSKLDGPNRPIDAATLITAVSPPSAGDGIGNSAPAKFTSTHADAPGKPFTANATDNLSQTDSSKLYAKAPELSQNSGFGAPTGLPLDGHKNAPLSTATEPSANTPPPGSVLHAALTPATSNEIGPNQQTAGKGKPNSTAKLLNPGNTRNNISGTNETAATAPTGLNINQPEPTEHIRSTVDLGLRESNVENMTDAPKTEQSTALEVNAVTAGHHADSPTGDNLQQAKGSDEGTVATPTGTEASSATESFSNVFQNQMDEVSSQISYWSAQGAQRASFTIGSAHDTQVAVTLSFAQGSLDVTFETDESSVRELLENNAKEALQQLMEAQGIVIGGVSVGAGRSQTRQESEPSDSTTNLARRTKANRAADAAITSPSTSRQTAPIITATKLDLYA